MPAMQIVSLWRVWDKYILALQARSSPTPHPASIGFAAVTDQGHFAAGVAIYPADRLVVAEFLVTNPDIPMWERHQAVVEMGKALQTYGLVANKTPMVMVRHRGIARVLTKLGFATNGAACFVGQA